MPATTFNITSLLHVYCGSRNKTNQRVLFIFSLLSKTDTSLLQLLYSLPVKLHEYKSVSRKKNSICHWDTFSSSSLKIWYRIQNGSSTREMEVVRWYRPNLCCQRFAFLASCKGTLQSAIRAFDDDGGLNPSNIRISNLLAFWKNIPESLQTVPLQAVPNQDRTTVLPPWKLIIFMLCISRVKVAPFCRRHSCLPEPSLDF